MYMDKVQDLYIGAPGAAVIVAFKIFSPM